MASSNSANERISGTSGPDQLSGGNGSDTIRGLGGDDTLRGGEGRDQIFGQGGDDRLIGGRGQDTLVGGAGNDVLDGGSGPDTAVFSDVAGNYSITRNADGTITVRGIAGDALRDGTDRLIDIEKISFTDQTIDASSITAPCFAAGTLIRTTRGEVAVEALREGDVVVLAEGGLAPVRWVGRRGVDLVRHHWPDRVRPILVRAGALAEGVPARDLRLSPEHALALDGVLVPAGLLANGRSILQEHDATRITYYHVELPAHAVLLAEGTPAESYLDLGNRRMFENGEEGTVALHPDFAPPPAALAGAAWCLPRLAPGPALEAIRARLIARADALAASAATAEADLHLLVDGAVIRGTPAAGGAIRFALPAGARQVAIRSRAACPAAEGAAWGGDRRALGVALSAILLRAAPTGPALRVPIEDPSLCRGFHPAEAQDGAAWRWTDGHAVLPERWLAGFEGAAVTLDLTVCGRLPRYWAEAA